jgi:hypothetical protein
MINVSEIDKEVLKVINYKRKYCGVDLYHDLDEIVNIAWLKMAENPEKYSYSKAAETAVRKHQRFIAGCGISYTDEDLGEKTCYKKFVPLMGKDLRETEYRNFWSNFTKHPDCWNTILGILDDHFINYRVIIPEETKYKAMIKILDDCPVCQNFGDFGITLRDDGWISCYCYGLKLTPPNNGITRCLSLALGKPYIDTKRYIYNYLLSQYRP